MSAEPKAPSERAGSASSSPRPVSPSMLATDADQIGHLHALASRTENRQLAAVLIAEAGCILASSRERLQRQAETQAALEAELVRRAGVAEEERRRA